MPQYEAGSDGKCFNIRQEVRRRTTFVTLYLLISAADDYDDDNDAFKGRDRFSRHTEFDSPLLHLRLPFSPLSCRAMPQG